MNDFKKFIKDNKKPLLIALAVIVVVVIIWIIVRKLTKGVTTATQKNKIEDLTGQTVTSGLNFDEMAKRMFAAWVTTIGTDENEVYSILEQLNNQADWEYLQARYQAYWNSMPVYEQLVHTFAGLGLSGILVSDFRRELNRRELQRCREILEGKNINPAF